MHEMSLWTQAVAGSLRDLRRRREMGFRPDKFDAQEPDYYEAHGYAPVGYAGKKFREPRDPAGWASRKTAIAVAAIIIGATVPAFAIVSMLNPSDNDTYHGASGEYASQGALDQAWDDPAAAGLAADDESYLGAEAYQDALKDGAADLGVPQVATDTDEHATESPSTIPDAAAPAEGPKLPEFPGMTSGASSAVTPPVTTVPAEPAPKPAAPQQAAPAKPAVPAPKPAAPQTRPVAPRVSAPVQQPTKPAKVSKPAKQQRSERAEREERARDKAQREVKAPKSETGGKTLVDHGVSPKSPQAPAKSKETKAPKTTPKAPETAPQAPAAPDQPTVSVDPADPANNPAADTGTAPEARTEPPSTDTERATSQDDRRVTPRSVNDEPSVTTESAEGPAER
jgi:hypothetical protein